jgi:hypothetical protein
MKPIIHIGNLKTGSTFLQSEVFSNKKICFCLGRYGYGGKECVDRLFQKFIWEDLYCDKYLWEKMYPQISEQFLGYINQANVHNVPLVVSNEAICYHPLSRNGIEERLSRLKALLPHAKILCVIRSQLSWLQSFYSSLIVDSGSTVSFDELIEINKYDCLSSLNVMSSIDYAYIHDVCLKYFDDVLFIPHEIFVTKPSEFLQSISEFMGIEFNLMSTEKLINKSRKKNEISLFRAINNKFPRGLSGRKERPYLGMRSYMAEVITQRNDEIPIEDDGPKSSVIARLLKSFFNCISQEYTKLSISGSLHWEKIFLENIQKEANYRKLAWNDKMRIQFCKKNKIRSFEEEFYPTIQQASFIKEFYKKSNIAMNIKIKYDLENLGYF